MSPYETTRDWLRRVHEEQLRRAREEKYAAKEQDRAKVEEVQYRDRTDKAIEGDDSV